MGSDGCVRSIFLSTGSIATSGGIRIGDSETAVTTAHPNTTTERHEYDLAGHYISTPLWEGKHLVFETDGTRVISIRGGDDGWADAVESCA